MNISCLKQYRRISKAGLLNASYRVVGLTAVFMLLFGKFLGPELEVLIFILTPIGLMLDFDANKYVISYSLPVRVKSRLHMLHYITLFDSLLAVFCVHVSYRLGGMTREITSDYAVFLAELIGCNLYYYCFCSPEFKKDILDEDKKQLIYQCIIGGIVGLQIAVRMKYGIASPLSLLADTLSPGAKGVVLLILTIIAAVMTYKSMLRLEHIVRSK